MCPVQCLVQYIKVSRGSGGWRVGKVLAAQTSEIDLGSLVPMEMTGMSYINSHPEMGKKGQESH